MGKYTILFLNFGIIMTLALPPVAAQSAEAPRASCTAFNTSEHPLERDYRIFTTKAEVDQSFKESYQAEPRLKGRAFWDESAKNYIIPYAGGLAKVPSRFFQGLSHHISTALKNQYVDGVYYPDMGHAHLYINTVDWDQIKKETTDSVLSLEKALARPSAHALYHTVEMVQLKEGDFARGKYPQDPWKLWRYFSRNLWGSFEPPANIEVIWAGSAATYNTVRERMGMTEVTTLYFSANKNGCFAFDSSDGAKFFDMTFETIPYKTAGREPSKVKNHLPTPH